jgi:hypothetical protein
MTSNAAEGGRILGSLGSADGKGIVRMEDRFETEIDDVWSALTDPSRLARWYGEVEGDLVVWEVRGMPLDLLSAFGAGVQIHVEDLADFLAGRDRRDDAKARWDQLHPAYQHLAMHTGVVE